MKGKRRNKTTSKGKQRYKVRLRVMINGKMKGKRKRQTMMSKHRDHSHLHKEIIHLCTPTSTTLALMQGLSLYPSNLVETKQARLDRRRSHSRFLRERAAQHATKAEHSLYAPSQYRCSGSKNATTDTEISDQVFQGVNSIHPSSRSKLDHS